MRPILFPAAFVFLTLVCGLGAILCALLPGGAAGARACARWWSRAVLACAGADLSVDGRQRLPAGARIFAANHQSNLDIPVLTLALPGAPLWLAKRELFRIPVFGRAIRAIGTIPVDRQDRAAAQASLAVAAAKIRSGAGVVIFPEGTRSPDGDLLPFKLGFVHLAADSGAPVVPVLVEGTAALWPKGSLTARPGRVRVQFLDPVCVPAGLEGDAIRGLADDVRGRIQAARRAGAAGRAAR